MSSILPKNLDMGRIEHLLREYRKEPPFKVLLVSPPPLRETRIMKTLEIISRDVPVITLLYLGAVLEKAGRSVRISEAETFPKLRQEIEEFSPYVVGITATTSQMPQAFKTAALVKEIIPQIIVIGGGPHMGFMYEEALNEGFFDIVVVGAGENPLLELTGHAQLREIKGIVYRDDKVVKVNSPEFLSQKEYNEFPPPAYHLLKDLERYKENILNISSRGCPFGCHMCASSELWGRKWIAQDAETMVNHLQEILEKFEGIGGLVFRYYDDTFVLERERITKFLRLLKEKEIHISFKCESRVDIFDEELASCLKEAGCTEVFFGIESGTQKFLNYIDKRITLEQAKKAVRVAHEYELKVCGSLMIGYPGETEKEVMQSVTFARKLELDRMQLSILTPFPGTKLFKEAEMKGWLKTREWGKYDGATPVMKLEGDLDKKLLWLLKEAYLTFYLDPRYVARQIKKGYLTREGYGKVIVKTFLKYITS